MGQLHAHTHRTPTHSCYRCDKPHAWIEIGAPNGQDSIRSRYVHIHRTPYIRMSVCACFGRCTLVAVPSPPPPCCLLTSWGPCPKLRTWRAYTHTHTNTHIQCTPYSVQLIHTHARMHTHAMHTVDGTLLVYSKQNHSSNFQDLGSGASACKIPNGGLGPAIRRERVKWIKMHDEDH
jgi:hypothetical protein